ncbi:MAG TPA: glycoside-pentoside-hexuronide (GPH):cation symporter [Clostridiales bacterium]|nr:glycoside-pentoside-hexuronide (GPH):cation symporter [Clostridiales bacterium]
MEKTTKEIFIPSAAERYYTSPKERISFYTASFFRDMSYAVLGYLSYFYIDILGLTGVALSLIMVTGRLWDGVNDPILGVYFDKHASREGKAIPFFRKTGIPGAILLLVMFSAPTFSENPTVNIAFRTALALVSYVLFETLHTLNGTAFMTLYNSISPNAQERSKIISVARMCSTMGSAVVGGVVPILLSFFENDNVRAKTYIYFGVAAFVALGFVFYNYLIVTNVKERVFAADGANQHIKDMFKGFFKNKLLLLLMLGNTIGGLINAGNTGLWFYTYNLGNPALQTYIGLAGFPTLLLGTYLVPKLTQRFEKKQIVLGCAAFQILINAVYMLLGYSNIGVVIAVSLLSTLPSTIRGTLYWSMVADTVDYLEWKTGERNDGMIYAIEGFLAKVVGSIGAVSTAVIIKVIAFVPNAPTQSDYTLKGLFYLPLAITIVSTVLAVIPYFFYDYSRSKQEEVAEMLLAKKEGRV